MSASHERPGPGGVEGLALLYLALPNVVFLFGWIAWPLGPIVAVATCVCTVLAVRRRMPGKVALSASTWAWATGVAVVWCVFGGQGHWLFANADWTVRDAVLLDLARDPWPVRYAIDGVPTVLRAPIGYFLPASLVGLGSVRVAELALLGWTAAGVALTFGLMLRDRPSRAAAAIRIGVFVAFSGMDIVGTFAHYNPHALGDHLEWWAFLIQYSSQTTQLFWVPNHALPGWIAIAWLAGCERRPLQMVPAALFVVFTPLWSPLTALGIAPLVGVAMLQRFTVHGTFAALRELLDWRLMVPVMACAMCVFPYLVAGADTVRSGSNADFRWVSEDLVPRYIEFVLFEFAGFAVLLLMRDRRDVLVWAAVAVLLVLPVHRFGPYNDLAMRGSIPALTLMAIRCGQWLSTPFAITRDGRARVALIVLLAIGAVTPFMEFARVFVEPPWAMDARASVPDVTRGTHYLTPLDRPWLERFLRRPGR